MADGPLVLAVDQGTSSTKALLVDAAGAVVARAVAPVTERQPRLGWVEQDADELWHSVRAAVASCVEPSVAHRIEAVGLSVQRESLVLWERRTGEPLGPLLSWQDQRTNDACRDLTAGGGGPLVRATSGMPLDPMFSALKARWLLDTYDPERRRAKAGELCLGTVDSWLLSRFGGEHVTEVGNASRTQLLNVDTRRWDERLLDLFGVPAAVLPRVVGSCGDFPAVRDLWPVPDGVAVRAVLGDSHAAMFAHAGWRPGVVKATYGTGSSVMAVGDGGDSPQLCRSVAWDIDGPVHAVEGNIRATGRTLSWLADLFGADVQTLLDEAPPAVGPVQFVPAFGGLGAPWWDPEATAVISGLTLGTRRGDLVAAALHAVAHQVDDVVAAVESAVGEVRLLLCDGGLTRSGRLMQTQADVGGRRIGRSAEQDLSCLGAADAAGLAAGLWTWADLEGRLRPVDEYHPATHHAARAAERARWHAAIARARSVPATGRSRA
ncbi:FGGY family carbohydrate kinase [Micromonospora sp. WMMC241]|uniref:FGGY family carbohydrate kinase n=1 Tax=Micromonospora sp. WMMC241 TaxID=3015159 RepID=UPI0022B5E8F9|nr:FGGY family carbohydrate kinase [Micromonospora sp. WMMC241]MCZ7436717.1 FGGY family carbohydrate kinase [Micromonospora sp. WMMC241]